VVVDVGAHVGDFTLEAAILCPQGRIYAVEPVAEFSTMIQINKLLNGFENIEIISAALGASQGVAKINLSGSSSSLHWGDGNQVQQVRQTTLARLMSDCQIDRIDLLKMDCEGSEWEILPNSEAILPKISQICMEYHPRDGWTGEKLATFLQSAGYTVEFTQGGWNGSLWASRMPDGAPAMRSVAGK
jgi:FkbM family methyltransferase